MYGKGLFRNLGIDELAVETGDIAQRNALGAFGCAGTGVGAVAEAEFVHLVDHGAGAAGTFNLSLWQEGELAYLGADEEHCRAVFAGCHAGAATDAGSGVHGDVGNFLGDRKAVGIGSTAAVERHVTSGLLDLVESVAVDHKVADNGEGGRAPGLDGDGVFVVELAHVELAGGDSLNGTVGMSVDVERTHAADAFATVAVKDYGLFVAVDELLVEHVEHFKERASGGDVLNAVGLERTRLLGTTLTPNLEIYIYSMFHFTCNV